MLKEGREPMLLQLKKKKLSWRQLDGWWHMLGEKSSKVGLDSEGPKSVAKNLEFILQGVFGNFRGK